MFLQCQYSFLLLLDHTQFTSIHGSNTPDSYVILFFTTLDFTFTTRFIHNWTLVVLWPSHFILSGAISNCPLPFPTSILDTFQPGGLIFQCHFFCLFVLSIGYSRQTYWNGSPFPLPVFHILSKLFTMSPPPWVALHVMAYSFIESGKLLRHNKAVIHEGQMIKDIQTNLGFTYRLSLQVYNPFLKPNHGSHYHFHKVMRHRLGYKCNWNIFPF